MQLRLTVHLSYVALVPVQNEIIRSRRNQLEFLKPLFFSIEDFDLQFGKAVLQFYAFLQSSIFRLELGLHLTVHYEGVATR